jgi:hypothetical protein
MKGGVRLQAEVTAVMDHAAHRVDAMYGHISKLYSREGFNAPIGWLW